MRKKTRLTPKSKLHLKGVRFAGVKRAIANAYGDAVKDQTLQAAAALSYYSILSIFPALILLSSVMANIPLPGFFGDVLVAMGRVVPQGTMAIVYSVLNDVPGNNSRAWLSFGTLGTVWVVSSAFDEMIGALDAAYDVAGRRPFWKTRLLALGLAAVTVFFLMCAIATMVIGPRAGEWIANKLSLAGVFLTLWPYLHWTIAICFTLFGVATIYFLAPNVKLRFFETLPGAIFAVACWAGLSHLLGTYFRHFGNFNRTYGTLGGVMALMIWLYWAHFILLAGGELNAELAKERKALQLSTSHA
jgi:membrane protein